MTDKLAITGGPSREDLFDALRLRTHNENREVLVTIEKTRILRMIVDSIGVGEGIAGNCWKLTLSARNGVQYEASFNTCSREGWIRPVSN